MQIVLIGGPQSTGSSVLRQILNRHDSISCLNETHLFAKPSIYSDWETSKWHLFDKRRKGLKSAGWHIFTGFDLDETDKQKIRKQLAPIKELSQETFFNKSIESLLMARPQIAMDKTPANVFTIKTALDAGLIERAIITIRDPYDTVASLIARGKHLMDAVILVKSALSQMAAMINDKRIHFVQYEDLVAQPNNTIKALCKFLDIQFDVAILGNNKPITDKSTHIPGWVSDETELINTRSLNRFNALEEKDKNRIIRAFNMISWKGTNKDIWAVMEYFGYSQKKNNMLVRVSFGSHLFKTLIKHWIKNNPYHIFNNPITLSKNI